MGKFSKKRKVEEGMRGRTARPTKKFRKQTQYDSDSSDAEDKDFKAVSLDDSGDDEPDIANVSSDSDSEVTNADDSEPEILDDLEEEEEDDGDDDEDAASSSGPRKRSKRNDPDAFATSMSKILSSKLSTSKRSDPVLARSAQAAQASKEISEHALEMKAKTKLKEEKKAMLEKGRVKDVLGASTAFDAVHRGDVNVPSVAETMATEKRLRKTAQRGVVKLFNAFRAAQVQAEEAERAARESGRVGYKGKQEKVTEMSKQGFLDLISGGGKMKGTIQEA